MSGKEGGSLCSKSSQEEYGRSGEEGHTDNDEQETENEPKEISPICGNSESQDSEVKQAANATSESEILESKLGSDDNKDKSKEPNTANTKEVGNDESAPNVVQEVSEDCAQTDVDNNNTGRDSEVSQMDHSAQNKSTSEELHKEDSGQVQTSMDSQDEEDASRLKKTEEISLQRSEMKERDVSSKDTEDPSNSESKEVSREQVEAPDQARDDPVEMEPTTNESSALTESQPSSSAADKRQERMRKLHELRMRKNEARKLNHVEVVEEAKRNKRPSNWEARKRKVEWEVAEEEARKQAELDGEDYDKVKQLETSALELERREKKKMRKKNPDQGFSDFAQAQHRQYERLTKQMEPDMVTYEKTKEEMGEKFYPGVNTIIHGHKPSEAAIDRMVQDLDKQVEKRAKFSRRRGINEDADVDYINDRNMRFNKKAARFYDQYTLETKQNLERGTAV